jgi:hypothetical protein
MSDQVPRPYTRSKIIVTYILQYVCSKPQTERKEIQNRILTGIPNVTIRFSVSLYRTFSCHRLVTFPNTRTLPHFQGIYLLSIFAHFAIYHKSLLTFVYVFLDAATLTEVFPCFFLSCKANVRVKLAKTEHGPHSSKIVVLFCVLFVLYRSMYCLCVNVYCTSATR